MSRDEIELQRDLAQAVGARRSHRRQRRDLTELAFERRRHQRRERVGIGAGKLRRHLDGREVDLRQRRDRQQVVAEQAAEQDGEAKQGCRDRPPDEGGRDAHCVARRRARRGIGRRRAAGIGAFTAAPLSRRVHRRLARGARSLRSEAAAAALMQRRRAGACRLLGRGDADMGAFGKPGEAGGHDALAGREAGADDRLRVVLGSESEVAHSDRIARLEYVGERALWPALHGGDGNDGRLF